MSGFSAAASPTCRRCCAPSSGPSCRRISSSACGQRLFEVYRRELQPIPGVAATLDRLTIPRCVASSSQMERLRLSLEVTGLLSRFVPHLFSATMVAQGKPAPDLFLHVAERMAVAPEACLVIEDSAAGIEAAQRAGMRVFAFVGGSHARSAAYRAKLAALAPDLIFDDISRLPELIGERRPAPPRRGDPLTVRPFLPIVSASTGQ